MNNQYIGFILEKCTKRQEKKGRWLCSLYNTPWITQYLRSVKYCWHGQHGHHNKDFCTATHITRYNQHLGERWIQREFNHQTSSGSKRSYGKHRKVKEWKIGLVQTAKDRLVRHITSIIQRPQNPKLVHGIKHVVLWRWIHKVEEE